MFDKNTHFKQVCQLLLSLIVALWGKLSPRYLSHFALMTPYLSFDSVPKVTSNLEGFAWIHQSITGLIPQTQFALEC